MTVPSDRLHRPREKLARAVAEQRGGNDAAGREGG
jgi:hypothetical protein